MSLTTNWIVSFTIEIVNSIKKIINIEVVKEEKLKGLIREILEWSEGKSILPILKYANYENINRSSLYLMIAGFVIGIGVGVITGNFMWATAGSL